MKRYSIAVFAPERVCRIWLTTLERSRHPHIYELDGSAGWGIVRYEGEWADDFDLVAFTRETLPTAPNGFRLLIEERKRPV